MNPVLFFDFWEKMVLNVWKMRNNWLSIEEGPGIGGVRINGDAKLGEELIACAYPMGRTSLCNFQLKKYSTHIYTKFIT
ncbi:hypothetical protein LguiA_002318 [Lonicera macranthoides]